MKVEDLEVYRRLVKLVMKVDGITMQFPKHEMYELGSQLRRSSNSVAANLAEGFGNKHTNIYTECISRSQGELRETIHHLRFVRQIGYITTEGFEDVVAAYETCSKMLWRLERSLVVNKKLEDYRTRY